MTHLASNRQGDTVRAVHFGEIFDQFQIPYRDKGIWLTSHEELQHGPWTIYLSTLIFYAGPLLCHVIPVLKDMGIPFRVLKDNYTVNKANGYGYGLEEVGKFITFYPPTVGLAVKLVGALEKVVAGFRGPEIQGAVRLGNIIYGVPTEASQAIPFRIPKEYTPRKRKRLLGKYYIPVQLMRSLPKGETLKCISVKRLSFSLCLVKEGKAYASDDFFGRDMTNRLNWQHFILGELSDLSFTPRVLDLFTGRDAVYLALEYIEGVNLRTKITALTGARSWNQIGQQTRTEILQYFSCAIEIIQKIHERNIVHRDVTDENFIVAPNGKLSIIDFELAYCLHRKQPNPPFGLGTFGYMSPQQHHFEQPKFADDIYSLGAILVFLLTGLHPDTIIDEELEITRSKLDGLSNNNLLTDLAIQCLKVDPEDRPDLSQVKRIVMDALEEHAFDSLSA